MLFLVFEAGMPLIGVAVGAPLAHAIGAWMLLYGDKDDEDDKASRLISVHGTALVGLGISISRDELTVGSGLGLTLYL